MTRGIAGESSEAFHLDDQPLKSVDFTCEHQKLSVKDGLLFREVLDLPLKIGYDFVAEGVAFFGDLLKAILKVFNALIPDLFRCQTDFIDLLCRAVLKVFPLLFQRRDLVFGVLELPLQMLVISLTGESLKEVFADIFKFRHLAGQAVYIHFSLVNNFVQLVHDFSEIDFHPLHPCEKNAGLCLPVTRQKTIRKDRTASRMSQELFNSTCNPPEWRGNAECK